MRSDIQALRGFSILVVLLYHAQFGWLKGGFLGVDIFFVISGFVITSKLMEGDGTFGKQVKEFYLRRAKRILPASLTVSILTAVLAIFFLPAVARSRLSLDALSSALFSTNLHFARLGNDYLAQSSDPSPFLHYWSLGVEEQFYLVWPILFLLLYKRNKKWLFPTLLVTTLFAFWFTSINPVLSFYIPFTRFWEFFAGIILAMNPAFRVPRRLALPTAIIGWVTISCATLFISIHDATPGFTTIIAVAGAMLVLLARIDVKQEFLLPRLGDYSFSLYLVHWPIVVFFLARNSTLTSIAKVEIILISLLFSFLLTHFVEKPFRFKKRLTLSLTQWTVVVLAGSIVSFGSLAATASTSQALDTSLPATYADGCHLPFGKAWPTKPCIYGDTSSTTEIILAGDSHAAQWFPVVEKIAKTRHWKLLNLTKSSCPATTLETVRNGKLDSSCAIWQVKLITKINMDKPKFVLISNFTEYQYPLNKPSGTYLASWKRGLTSFVSQIRSPYILIGDTPKPTSSVIDFLPTRSKVSLQSEELAKKLGAQYIDTASWLCTDTCPIRYAGTNTYRDATHISVHTALALYGKLLAVLPSI